ncbi:MAG: LpxL/LpxP family Kdo(2)-lipid IV(A) lauroyl/palmitoleoyl acyltransferase [Porticoccaceae bacterium]
MEIHPTPFTRDLLHPRYWPTWLLMGLWWLLAQLPYPALMALGRGIGHVLYAAGSSRRRIALRNIELCFPDLSPQEHKALVKENFANYGMGLFEVPIAWWWSDRRLDRILTIEGLENIRDLDGQGALLMAMHFTHLELGGQALARHVSADAVYRVHKNAVYEYIQTKGRKVRSPGSVAYPRKDVRGITRALRNGRVIWYAPDHDLGPSGSVFVPFFGIETATITATSKLAHLGKARVVPFSHFRRADGSGYDVRVHPALDNFPSGDDVADARRVNEIVEGFVRRHPEQYLWAHRRFKTRPPGQPSLYTRARR